MNHYPVDISAYYLVNDVIHRLTLRVRLFTPDCNNVCILKLKMGTSQIRVSMLNHYFLQYSHGVHSFVTVY